MMCCLMVQSGSFGFIHPRMNYFIEKMDLVDLSGREMIILLKRKVHICPGLQRVFTLL